MDTGWMPWVTVTTTDGRPIADRVIWAVRGVVVALAVKVAVMLRLP